MFLDDLWVDERYRHHGIGSILLREVERIAREKGCLVVTHCTASFVARPFYEKHGYTVFTTLKKTSGYLLRGERKNGPKGHTRCERCKMI